MIDHSIANISSLINHQLKTQERTESYLVQLETLLTFARTYPDFSQVDDSLLQNYFWILSDLTSKALRANQVSIEELLHHKLD